MNPIVEHAITVFMAFFAIMNLVKLIGVISLGLLTIDTVLIALAFVPLAFIGSWLGVKINQHLDKQLFLKVMVTITSSLPKLSFVSTTSLVLESS